MRPGVGGSDWDCWNCAAASRRGCPAGLAGHADADKNGTRRGDKADKKGQSEGSLWGESGPGDCGKRSPGRIKIFREKEVGDRACGSRTWRKMMRQKERKHRKEKGLVKLRRHRQPAVRQKRNDPGS